MTNTYRNPCVRCGKERIVLRTWEEKLENGTITNTEMVCPDPVCQKAVEAENRKQTEKNEYMKKRHEERMQKRIRDKAAAKLSKRLTK